MKQNPFQKWKQELFKAFIEILNDYDNKRRTSRANYSTNTIRYFSVNEIYEIDELGKVDHRGKGRIFRKLYVDELLKEKSETPKVES